MSFAKPITVVTVLTHDGEIKLLKFLIKAFPQDRMEPQSQNSWATMLDTMQTMTGKKFGGREADHNISQIALSEYDKSKARKKARKNNHPKDPSKPYFQTRQTVDGKEYLFRLEIFRPGLVSVNLSRIKNCNQHDNRIKSVILFSYLCADAQ